MNNIPEVDHKVQVCVKTLSESKDLLFEVRVLVYIYLHLLQYIEPVEKKNTSIIFIVKYSLNTAHVCYKKTKYTSS